VFDLGGSSSQSTAPVITAGVRRAGSVATTAAATAAQSASAAGASTPDAALAHVIAPTNLAVQAWDPNTSNTQPLVGHVSFAGQPVRGAVVSIGGWAATATNRMGEFTYPVDVSLAGRHVATITNVSRARINGKSLTDAESQALLGRSTGISVGYSVTGVSAHVAPNGNVVLSGHLSYGPGNLAPPTVALYSYLLQGKITDANGNSVAGAVVTTRTNDRKYWTQSRPTAASGSYASFLVAADQEGDNPVPMQVGVAVGNVAYAEPIGDQVNFARLKSAVLNIQLPATPGGPLPLSTLNPQPIPGAIYTGLLVGVVGGNGGVVRPVSASWPDRKGYFRLVLPSSARGQTVIFWEDQRQFFSTASATPGGKVAPSVYPTSLPATAPQGLAAVKLPG
jgi:hypothetical protein